MSQPRDNDYAAAPAPPTTLTDRVRSLRLPNGSGPPAPRGSVLPWVLCGLLLLTTLAFGYKAFTAAATKPADTPTPGTAKTDPVAGSGDVALESKGYVIPTHQIQVSPEVSGKLLWLDPRFEEGAEFKEGDLLARIDDTLYKARRDRAKAMLADAERWLKNLKEGSRNQEIEQAKASEVAAEEEHRRLQTTERMMERSGTATKFEELSEQRGRVRKADADLLAARKSRQALEVRTTSDIDQAQAKADLARAELSEAQKQLDYCEIHAPVTGTILTKKAEKGNYVNPIAFNVSASLCDMADLSDLEVDLYIQERDIAQVHPKQECRVVSEAYPDRPPYQGTVSRLMPTADRAKGAIPVRVKLTVPGGEQGMYLRPDMSVIVSFLKDGK